MIKKMTGSSQDVYALFYANSHVSGRYSAYVRGERCKTDEDFLKECSAAFQFPSYFGDNWNAWDECINDLEWLKFDSISLVIDNYPRVFSNEKDPLQHRNTLENYLNSFVSYWNSNSISCDVYLVTVNAE